MTPFSIPITAGPQHIDMLGHVNNAVWVQWIQEVATAHWNALALPEHRDAYIWMVTRHEIDYRGNIAEGETVRAETWVAEPPRGARFNRYVRFTGPDGKVCVEGKSTWVLIELASRRILRIPPEMAAPFLA